MGSLAKEEDYREGKKAMWVYPKVVGPSPSERWGHSSCFSQGLLYVFGGCCGGLHFSEVLILNLETMAWSTLMTSGNGPGPRDSHSATLWENRIIVFGGTNGSKKVNDLHILDLGSKEWTEPVCHGPRPPARESHTATLVGDDKLVVFGGSGEGVGNYLNDLHILDLKTMRWTSPEVKGDIPPPRDSHVSVAIGGRLFVYGGDCGDRYHGNVDVFDLDSLMWSRMEVGGSSPGRRAGHAAVRIGMKVCVIGGVGDKKYYNDVWVLDTAICSWSKLNICGQPPQGRFSHTAIVTDTDIAIYGGCGEDERPLGELLILHLGAEHPNGRYNISMCKSFGNHWNRERRRRLNGVENGLKTMLLGNRAIEAQRKEVHELDVSHTKRRRTVNANTWERESEQEEHSLSVSQNSSPSQSDQEQTTTVQNPTATMTVSKGLQFPSLNQSNKSPVHPQSKEWIPQQHMPDVYILGEHRPTHKPGNFIPSYQTGRGETEFLTTEGRSSNQSAFQNMIGAEVQGKVDGAFDSGYLMTATVNGRIFRGVLFAPGPSIMCRGSNSCGQIPVSQPCSSNRASTYRKSPILQPVKSPGLGSINKLEHVKVDLSSPVFRAVPPTDRELRERSDLQGVVLTLGGPGSGHG